MKHPATDAMRPGAYKHSRAQRELLTADLTAELATIDLVLDYEPLKGKQ